MTKGSDFWIAPGVVVEHEPGLVAAVLARVAEAEDATIASGRTSSDQIPEARRGEQDAR